MMPLRLSKFPPPPLWNDRRIRDYAGVLANATLDGETIAISAMTRLRNDYEERLASYEKKIEELERLVTAAADLVEDVMGGKALSEATVTR